MTKNDPNCLRASAKQCVWLGSPTCHHDASKVLWTESDGNKTRRLSGRMNDNLETMHGGKTTFREAKARNACVERGGVTPFNVLPIGSGGDDGESGEHSARTPLKLADWWTRYICPPDGTILDPFMGSGTTAIAAIRRNCRYIGIERFDKYYPIAKARVAEELAKTALFDCQTV